jgi:hypothetical protein
MSKGSFRLRRRGESGRGIARQHAVTFERKLSTIELAACEIISYRHDGKEDKLTRESP